jgi:hypothetical protein
MQLRPFTYEGSENPKTVRTVQIGIEVWFAGNDIAAILGFKDPKAAVVAHCKESGMKLETIPTDAGPNQLRLINESNVYRLIMRSKIDSAEKFQDWVVESVLPEIRKTGGYGVRTHDFIGRFNLNRLKVSKGYFSVMNELYTILQASFEAAGYILPEESHTGEKIRPDVSVGRMFADYLRKEYPGAITDQAYYDHEFLNGFTCPVRQYPNRLVGIFRDYVELEWMLNHAEKYLGDRDKESLKYLPAVLGTRNVITFASQRSIKW